MLFNFCNSTYRYYLWKQIIYLGGLRFPEAIFYAYSGLRF